MLKRFWLYGNWLVSEPLKKYNARKKVFKTKVIARNNDEMLKILNFDFGRYPEEYEEFSEKLQQFLHNYTNKRGQVSLEVVHNGYIISKS